MAKIDFANLPKLIEQLQTLSNAVPSGFSDAHREARRLATAELAERLAALGARTLQSGDAMSIVLAGLRSSATSGLIGALHNWIGAARKKLAEHEAAK